MVRVAFYKAASGNLLDKLIGLFSRGTYSHVELVFSDGKSFSSSPRDGGVRFTDIRFDDKWAVLTIPDGLVDEQPMRAFAEAQAGKGYDWTGVLGFVLPIREDKARWFCSEIVTHLLQVGGVLAGANEHTTSPTALYTLVAHLIATSTIDLKERA